MPRTEKASETHTPRFIAFREWLMKPNRSTLCYAAFVVALALFLSAPASAQEPEKPNEGVNSGNYNVKQTVEFGGRMTTISGNREVYNTFVDLGDGVRLLEHTLEMRSLNHQGWLFDSFYASSFGYGGDPNNVTRIRAYKNKWYNFNGTFRRDYTQWDYNLLANPLNPNTLPASAPAGFSPIIPTSPHAMGLVRRLSDYNVTLLPQSRVRFRLGYSRNISEGPSLTTFHQGTEALVFQDWKTTVNTYQMGVDFKVLPRTNISYDQFLIYYKGDTSWVDQHQLFPLASGALVDVGVSLNATANQPCSGLFNGPPPGTVKPVCNGYLAYSRQGPVRTNFPTEQLSFQSNYFKNIDLSGRFVYSASDNAVLGFNELFSGFETRTNLRQRTETGPAAGTRVSVSTDLGFTWHVTDKFRVLDMFRFSNFRLPMQWLFTECSFFSPSTGAVAGLAAAPTIFNATASVPVTCPTPANGVTGTPVHSGSSPADIATGASSLFLKMDLKNNLFEAEYDFTRHFGARLGYRFRRRTIVESDFESGTFVFFPNLANSRAPLAPLNVDANGAPVFCPAANNRADGSCLLAPEPESDSATTEINEHSALLGIWARPMNNLRVSFDMELMSADNAFVRVDPRQWQHYKARASYKPSQVLSFGASVNILESRNNVPTVKNLQHNRSFGFSVAYEPNPRIGFDLGYNYNDILSQINICYVSSAAPAGLSKCPGSTVLVQQISTYTDTAHYGHFGVMWKPFDRLTTNFGYEITSTVGSTIILTPSAPVGPLAYNYHRPYAGIAMEIAKGLFYKVNWAYYDYNEKEQLVPVVLTPDFTAPRDFRGNTITLAVRYSF
jgi:hypothetical protein